jgi:hypothetical protein
MDANRRLRFSCAHRSIADCPELLTAPVIDLINVRDTDISFLRENPALRVLFVGESYSLRGLDALTQLRELILLHIPKAHSLEPVASLRELQYLTISTLPSWDASRKTLKVDTLAPLGELRSLVSLSLTGVQPERDGLSPLYRLEGLRLLQISHVYTFRSKEYAELAAKLPQTVGACLRPCYSMPFAPLCRKCGRQTVCLIGPAPRARRFLCLVDDKRRLLEHIAAWNEISGREFPYPERPEDVAVAPPMHYLFES